MQQLDLALFDKMITLFSWSPECLDSIGSLADRENFCTVVRQIEAALERSAGDKPLSSDEAQCTDKGCYDLYKKLVDSAPLLRLMKSEPLLSKSSPEVVKTLTRLADVTPDKDTIFRTRERVFMRILKIFAHQNSISVEELIVQDLTKLIAFDEEQSALYGLLEDLAKTDAWADQMAAMEQQLEKAESDVALALLPAAQQLYERLGEGHDSEDSPLKKRFVSEPRFSTILPREVLALGAIKEKLKPLKEKLKSLSPAERQREIAKKAPDLLHKNDKTAIATAFGLRCEAATYFLELRKFAKLDALNLKWPKLAEQLRIEGSGFLKSLEATVSDQGQAAGVVADPWKQFLQDQQLTRFLRLRPLFREIYQDEVTKYFAASQATAKAPQATTKLPGAPEQPPAPVHKPGMDLPAYENLLVLIKSTEPEVAEVTLTEGITMHPKGEAHLSGLRKLFSTFVTPSDYAPPTRTFRATAVRSADSIPRYREIGLHIFQTFFGGSKIASVFSNTLRTKPKVRIALQLEEPPLDEPPLEEPPDEEPEPPLQVEAPRLSSLPLSALPWECLYMSEAETFLGLTQKCSIVRHIADKPSSLVVRTLTPPLKILVVHARPTDAYFIDAAREIETLQRALLEPREKGQVEIHISEDTTLSGLQRALRRFRPHLFHFIGHGIYDQQRKSGALVLQREDGTSHPVEAAQLQTLLTDSNISLAVLNSCDTGTSHTNDVVTGVAGALVKNGIPAAIATMRPVEDAAAVMFTREFYRSFVDGYPLEEALIEARKALKVENWDWAAYALFAGTLDLQSLRLLPLVRGQEPS